MRRNYTLLLSRGWVPVGPPPAFNRPQHWAHPSRGAKWYMTDQAVREEGGKP